VPARADGVPPRSGPHAPASVLGVLHPVGDLPAAVYWRRRLVVLVALLGVLGGGGWLAVALADRSGGSAGAPGSSTGAAPTSERTPALERVLPSLAGVRTPVASSRVDPAEARPRTTPATETAPVTASATPTPTGPTPGSQCADDMIDLTVSVPDSVASGSKPTLRMVVTNTSRVACVRTLDKELQEMVIARADGTRLWGSNDCFPEESDDRRRLESGESVVLSLVWSGLSSDPGCTAERTALPPGDYVVRGRLHTEASENAPLRIT
jgi:hypothetical protein